MSTRNTILPTGRLAPTPTGMLHVGNARSFLAAWLGARATGGRVILRVEDIDRERVRPHFEQAQLDDLRWLGLDWDEGPDCGGPNAPYRQSERLDHYHGALDRLRSTGRAYPCVCSRRELRTAASAPHQGDELRYPGTCRGRFHDAGEARAHLAAAGTPGDPAWRFDVPSEALLFEDLIAGPCAADPAGEVGDFIIARRDGWPAYQLAVVVDDAAMGITQVVRGADLLTSTARQMLLYEALGLSERMPREWAHVPLVLDGQGQRMAKRSDSAALAVLRERGVAPERAIGVLAHSLGLVSAPEPITARELLPGFEWRLIVRAPVVMEPALLFPAV